MRITCPNCNAQYEVGDEMIPAEGRDVQCSNCGTTWYQDRRARTDSAVETRTQPRPDPPAEDEEDDDETPDPVPRRAGPPRSEPDQGTLDILREERAHEERLRADDRGQSSGETPRAEPAPEPKPAPKADPVLPPKSEPDESVEEVDDPRARAAAERQRMAAAATLARGRDQGGRPSSEARPATGGRATYSAPPGKRPAAAVAPATEDDDYGAQPVPTPPSAKSARGSRRNLLPDIEEINSSLRPDEKAMEAEAEGETDAPVATRRSNGFRIGFLTVGGLVLVLLGLYLFADPIAQAVPQAALPLADYAAWIDAQRIALAAAVEALTKSIAPEG